VPVLPLLALLTAPAWAAVLARTAGARLLRIPAGVVLALSLLANALGLAVPYALAQDWLAANVQPLFAPETFTRPAYSPLALQARLIGPETIHLAWWRALSGRGDRAGLDRWAAGQIAAGEAEGDAVLHLRPVGTQAFADAYGGHLPAYGLFPAGVSEADVAQELGRLRARHRRLWLVAEERAEGPQAWEWQLRRSAFLLLDQGFGGEGGGHLALFALEMPGEPEKAPADLVFGEPAGAGVPVDGAITLRGYEYLAEARPGGELELALRWQTRRAVKHNYRVFVHLLDALGHKVAQSDGEPALWVRPTSSWAPGEEIVDRHGMLLSGELAPGVYQLRVGLYDPASGQRLHLVGSADDGVTIGPIKVQP
jgi:hypothetical protein